MWADGGRGRAGALLGEILRPEDVSDAFVWLSSEEPRFVTGIALPIAAGATAV